MAVTVIGLGPGDGRYMSPAARQALEEAALVAGDAGHHETLKELIGVKDFIPFRCPVDEYVEVIAREAGSKAVAVLVSGDPMLYSLGAALSRRIPRESLSFVPGLSSFQLLCARTKVAWNDAQFVSLHGRPADRLEKVSFDRCTVMFLDAHHDPAMVAARLAGRLGTEHRALVGVNLGYPGETIYDGTLGEVAQKHFEGLAVMVLPAPAADALQPYEAGFGDLELVGVGIGPGEPGLLTLKAARLLESADLVLAPAARIKERSLAAAIIAGAGIVPKELLELEFPMTRDEESLAAAWTEAAKPALQALDNGKRVVFITLGDPSLYSTWLYFRRAVLARRPGTRTGTVPGIMAAGAAAAALNRPLAEKAERLALLPLPSVIADLDAYLPLADRLIVYKIGARLGELCAWVESRGLAEGASLACAVGQAGREQLGQLLTLGAEGAEGYLSLAIINTTANTASGVTP